jgi:hypothetical protein
MIILACEGCPGDTARQAAEAAVEFASRVRCVLDLDWNGQTIVVGPNDTPESVVRQIDRQMGMHPTAQPEVSEQSTQDQPNPYRPILKETLLALQMMVNAADPESDPSPLPLRDLVKLGWEVVIKAEEFLADPQQVERDTAADSSDGSLQSLRDIRDQLDTYRCGMIDRTTALDRIAKLTLDFLTKAEGRPNA